MTSERICDALQNFMGNTALTFYPTGLLTSSQATTSTKHLFSSIWRFKLVFNLVELIVNYLHLDVLQTFVFESERYDKS